MLTALTLPAVLTHAESAAFASRLKPQLTAQAAEVMVDARELRQFDSSALALLLDYRRQAQAAGKQLAVQSAPQRLRELANLYGVADLISTSSAAAA